jgi:soluble lytic murein transglycosylase-like protein
MSRDSRLATLIALAVTFAVAALLLLAALVFIPAEEARAASSPPRAMQAYRSLIIRAARSSAWGMAAPVAVLAAQIHQESRGDERARSPVGAMGLCQIMPSTAAWLAETHPELGRPDSLNPAWAVRAMCAYDRWIWERVRGAASGCDRWAMTLSAYNGGLGWVVKKRAAAARLGLEPGAWWDQVEAVEVGRATANERENRGYSRLILLRHQSLYRAWGPGVACEVRP